MGDPGVPRIDALLLGAPAAGARQATPNEEAQVATNYQRGRAFEYRVRDRLLKDGAVYVMRAASSKGAADLIALWSGDSALAWAAGFFAGEGSTTADCRTDKCYLHVVVSQKDRRALDRFAEIVGVGKVYVRRDDTAFQWAAYSDDAFDALTLMWPWMSEAKKEQARIRLQQAGYPEPSPLPTGTWMVQAKRDGRLPKAEREQLIEIARDSGAEAVLAKVGPNGRGVEFVHLREE